MGYGIRSGGGGGGCYIFRSAYASLRAVPAKLARSARTRKSRRPVMRVLDVLGHRWALRVLWELRDGPRTFRALREACDEVSPSSLNQRLAELRALGVVEAGADGYGLTASGSRLGRIVLELHRWAEGHLPRS